MYIVTPCVRVHRCAEQLRGHERRVRAAAEAADATPAALVG